MAIVKLFQPTVVLKDGTTLDGSCGLNETNDDLWVNLESTDLTMIQIVTLFSDPDKTNVIRVNRTELTYDEYEGYTTLTTVNSTAHGTVSIRLRK